MTQLLQHSSMDLGSPFAKLKGSKNWLTSKCSIKGQDYYLNDSSFAAATSLIKIMITIDYTSTVQWGMRTCPMCQIFNLRSHVIFLLPSNLGVLPQQNQQKNKQKTAHQFWATIGLDLPSKGSLLAMTGALIDDKSTTEAFGGCERQKSPGPSPWHGLRLRETFPSSSRGPAGAGLQNGVSTPKKKWKSPLGKAKKYAKMSRNSET